MGFKPCATKPQSSLDDNDLSSVIKKHQDLSASLPRNMIYFDHDFSPIIKKYQNLCASLPKHMTEMKNVLEKMIASLHESLLRPLHKCDSSSLSSTSSTHRHKLSSYSRSKDLLREKVSNNSFENMSMFHNGPILE